ncbi:aconitate hydratase [Euzebya rosea]|uniref:aconitate hydratase n=1 Tax=Euzebya rosea TaxID=2052804 RepID=UPI000D3E103E|nr:aconitate hydratase [Euzebya rosea]
MSTNSFGAKTSLSVGDKSYEIFDLSAVDTDLARLPYSIRILLENLLRNEDGENITADDIRAVASYDPSAEPTEEILFTPARVLLQDFTGVPAVVDLAVMRDAVADLGGDPNVINPRVPVDLVIDHSIQVDSFAVADAFQKNAEIEFERNYERYQFLRWGQTAFDNFRVVPPNTGIVHQVNLEYLGQVVFTNAETGQAYPDSLVGTDSHTPMINGLGVVGWGVGGIEAEAAMLGQPISMLIPQVVGFELTGELPEGATATDMVLTVTEMLREKGVVGKFVEFFGEGVSSVRIPDRATLGNMSPEFGSTISIFPIDDKTLEYMRFTGRPDDQIALTEAYAKAQGLWHDPANRPAYTDTLSLDLSTIVPSLAGPTRPQDRVPLTDAKRGLREVLPQWTGEVDSDANEAGLESFPASDAPTTSGQDNGQEPHHVSGGASDMPERASNPTAVSMANGEEFDLDHGDVVIAAITSCTNTSNPSVMIAAGLLAKNAVDRGLTRKPWVKTSLAPGSKVVTDYYDRAGLTPYLEKLGFNLVGYGCTTCIGNSGPLPPEISKAIHDENLAAVSVLSGNRNFEGRIGPDVKLNYLMSPPLVVAYAIAGTMDIDLYNEPIGTDADGNDVMMADIWPSNDQIAEVVGSAVQREQFVERYADVFTGDEQWQNVPVSGGSRFEWSDASTYIQKPTFFDGMGAEPGELSDISGARVLVKVGDSVTTDHISPAGAIKRDSPAGAYLMDKGVDIKDFNSYGSRRGNHEVMMRGTFANIRLRNQMAPGTEGGYTRKVTDEGPGEVTSIYEASMEYQAEGTPLIVLAGEEYGTGSSRDWAAKGTILLGVKAVIAKSYERIHRSNLIGMGVLPLQFKAGEGADELGLTGEEEISITGITGGADGKVPDEVTVQAGDTTFTVDVRLDTPNEQAYYRHGGILHYVLRQLASA